MSESASWVKTPVAVQQLGRSRSQLMRLKESGFLVCGTHWLKGPSLNSTYTWNVEAITEVLKQQAAMPAPGNTDSVSND